MLARFFIDRPIFAWVISIVIVLGGLLCLFLLPIAQYPEIAPPSIQVSCQYPGADATVVADTIGAPIEQQVNGVERMLYMSSQSNNDGSYNLTVTFELGTDLNMAQVLVQNRVALAQPVLPDVVKAVGVVVKKRSPSILLVVNVFSEIDPTTKKPFYNQLYLSNYATIHLRDPLARLSGVGDVNGLGQQDYSMRVWLDPDRLASRNMTADDVVRALREQNVQVAAGQIGQQPVPAGQEFQYTMTTLGRLVEADQFAGVVLKTGSQGEVTFLRDVARIERGAKNQDTRSRLDGKASAGIAIYQLPGSNALDTADRVQTKMLELKAHFPRGLEYAIVYDTTPFITESVVEVFNTLRDAVILVAIVVLLFLQDWKALILPLIDVAVSLIGTCVILVMMGFSLNNLTLFGLVLAIGIVVDDAIVVLENIERWIAKGLPVREATIKAMDEITGPIIAITLVLSSVFLPSAFLGGITGQFYRQFALTIAASMILSAINAMTMTPARAASIFKDPKPGEKHEEHREALPWWGVAILCGWLGVKLLEGFVLDRVGFFQPGHTGALTRVALLAGLNILLFLPGVVVGYFAAPPINWFLGIVFRLFNRFFDGATEVYGWIVGWSLRLSGLVVLLYVGLLVLTGWGFTRVPSGFIPPQDKGYLVMHIQLPDAASLERTLEVGEAIEKIALETEGVGHTVSIPGMAFILNGAVSSNFGSMFIILKPFHERRGRALYSETIAAKIRGRCYQEIQEARIAVFGAPAVEGLGNAGGFRLMIESTGEVNYDMLQGQADNLAAKANQIQGIVGTFNSFRSATPQLHLEIDRTKCKTMGIALTDVFDTLQVFLGGYYVNDFNEFGRTWQVNVQADAPFRINTQIVSQLKVRNAAGEMVPLGAVAEIRDSSGPVFVTRYNLLTAATINGGSLPGVSTGAVVNELEGLCKQELANNMTFEWTELTLLQKQSGKSPSLTGILENPSVKLLREAVNDLQQNPISAFLGAVVLVFLVLAAQYESWSLPLAVILVVPMCLLCALAGVAMAHMDVNIFVQIGFVVLVGLAAKNAILIVEFARDKQQEGASRFDATIEAGKVRLRPIIMTSFAFILGVSPLVFAEGAGAEMRRTLGTAVFSGMLGVTLFGIFLTPVFYYVVVGVFGLPKTQGKPPTAGEV